MPNVRIVLDFRRRTLIYAFAALLSVPTRSETDCHVERSFTATAAQAAVARRATGAGRSRSPPRCGGAGGIATLPERVPGAQGPRTHPLRRLGEQGHRLGFLGIVIAVRGEAQRPNDGNKKPHVSA